MAELSASNNDQQLSAADYADLQHIGSQLPAGHPVRAKIDKVLAGAQPNAGLAPPAGPPPIPQPKPLTDRLTEIEKPDSSQRWSPMEGVKAIGNVGAGAMTPILHPIRTLAGIGGMVTAVPEMIAGRPFGSTVPGEMVNQVRDNPYGAIESGIGQAATFKGAEDIPSEVSGAPVRAAARAANKTVNSPFVRNAAPIVAGAGAAHAVGVSPWIGMAVGRMAGKYLMPSGDVTIPGERLGLPPEPPPKPAGDFTMNAKGGGPVAPPTPSRGPVIQIAQPRTPSSTLEAPLSNAPVSGEAGARQFTRPEAMIARPGESASPKIETVPTENDVAKGMGFASATQAVQRLGPLKWAQTYSKVSGAPIKPPVSEIGPLGKPTPFERPYTPVQIPMSRGRMADNLEDQGIKQEMEGEVHPGLPPTSQRALATGRKGGGVSLLPHDSTSLQGEQRMVDLEKGRELAARNSMDQTKGSKINQFRGVAAPQDVADVQANRPLPGSDVAANRTIGGPIRPGEERFDYITGKKKK